MAHGGQKTIGRRKSDDHGKRAHKKDKNAVKFNRRDSDPRIQAAAAETRRAQEELDQLIVQQAENPVMGMTDGAIWAREEAERKLREASDKQIVVEKRVEAEEHTPAPRKPTPEPQTVVVEKVYVYEIVKVDTKELPQDGEGKWKFSYHTAVMMVKAGYNIKHVIKYTGIGYKDLEHLPLDEEGYFLDDSLEGDEE